MSDHAMDVTETILGGIGFVGVLFIIMAIIISYIFIVTTISDINGKLDDLIKTLTEKKK